MLSYKEYKNLNESVLGAPLTLGLGKPQVVGTVGAVGGTEAEEESLEEAKKKMKKKMLGEVPPEEELGDDEVNDKEVDDESGDGEIEDKEVDDNEIDDESDADEPGDEEESEDDVPDMFCKKCKSKMKKGACKKCGFKMKKKMKKKMKNEMTEEEIAWWSSVHSMMDTEKYLARSWDGFTPGPGEPGFAPQQKVGE